MLEIQKVDGKIMPRYIFVGITAEHQNFTDGCRVLSANFMAAGDQTQLTFIKKHDPGEPHWKDGGFECMDEYGVKRAFYLDALIIAPNQKAVVIGESKRGRKPNPNKVQPVIDPNAPKKGRGRPKVAEADRKTQPYVPNGKQRGRPALTLEEKALRQQKLNENITTKIPGKRGRKPLSPEEKAIRDKIVADKLAEKELLRSQGLSRKRGRPSKK